MNVNDACGYRSHFCRRCGSPVQKLFGDYDYYWIPAGGLSDLHGRKIVAHLFKSSAAGWERSGEAKVFDDIPDIEKLIRLMHPR